MPVYVYECDACNGRFEYSQSMSEPSKTVCETCGGKLQKIIVPIAFHLKGGGWYKDLYSSSKGSGDSKGEGKGEKGEGKGEKGEGKGEKGESKGEGKSEKSESKGESKSESKSETKPSGGGSGSSSS